MNSGPQSTSARPAMLHFDGYTLDLTAGWLRRGDAEIKLRPKSYEALKFLVENAGRLVPKPELLNALWPDAAVVSDDSLTHCIMDVRRALEDSGQQIIKTVPGRGYQFTAKVESAPAAEVVAVPLNSARSSRLRNKGIPIAAGLCLLILSGLIWFIKTRTNRNWLPSAVSRIEKLTATGNYVEAFELASQVMKVQPAEPTTIRLLNEFSDDLSVSTTPSGANVYLRSIRSDRERKIGVTPIHRLRVARDEYLLAIRNAGYADFERTLSSALERSRPINREQGAPRWNKTPWDIRIEQPLMKAGEVPTGMVPIPGGERRLRAFARPTAAPAKLNDYFIDKYEVSNRAFKAFIDARGYERADFWERGLSRGAFNDKTRLAGPRGWVGGTFPQGKELHPVTGITWHEAAAFCRWQGKDLPTLYQWEYAARGSMSTPFGITVPWGVLNPADVARRANFASSGTQPVNFFPFGMSLFGVYGMAGNVAEWIRNRYDDGFTAVGGGGWNDPLYRYGIYGPRPALEAADTLGFRCARTAEGDTGDQGGMAFTSGQRVPSYPISSEAAFRTSKASYEYVKKPLNAVIVGKQKSESWLREEIDFDGYDGERAKAFLYLPSSAVPPYQVIHFLSGANWWNGVPVVEEVESPASRMAPYLRGGRAILLVVLKGFAGREPVAGYARLESGSTEHRDILKHWVIDMRRAIDYLETRSDIDARKLAFWNNSSFEYGAVFAAVDGRSSAIIVIGAGFDPWMPAVSTEANTLHFVPHIRPPKLMVNGQYDDRTPERTTAEPLFRLMQEPKRRARFVGGHIPPVEIAVPLFNAFLDETFGPVKHH
jgi:eukaryotic-like serine/threonine-protein kinase